MRSTLSPARASGLLGFLLIFLGGGIVLDADLDRLGYLTVAVGAGALASRLRSDGVAERAS